MGISFMGSYFRAAECCLTVSLLLLYCGQINDDDDDDDDAERFGGGWSTAVEGERGQTLRRRRGMLHLLLRAAWRVVPTSTQTMSHMS